MSGPIINPFSSDFNPTSSISFSAEPVPLVAYGLIGLTTLTLAYVTMVEVSQGDNSNVSAVSLLPKITSTPAQQQTNLSPSISKPTNSILNSPTKTYGGKTNNKRNNHKKTKRKISK